jgi:hypothetical protein
MDQRSVLKLQFMHWTEKDLVCVKPHPVAIEAVCPSPSSLFCVPVFPAALLAHLSKRQLLEFICPRRLAAPIFTILTASCNPQLDLIHSAMPSIKHCFLYRDAGSNIESWHALLNRSEGVKEGERCLPPSYFTIIPDDLKDPFGKNEYLYLVFPFRVMFLAVNKAQQASSMQLCILHAKACLYVHLTRSHS